MRSDAKVVEIEVQARDGSQDKVKARMIVCACGSSRFRVYFTDGPDGKAAHTHLQCVDCDETLCQGGCA